MVPFTIYEASGWPPGYRYHAIVTQSLVQFPPKFREDNPRFKFTTADKHCDSPIRIASLEYFVKSYMGILYLS